MRLKWLLVIPMVLLVTGCSTVGKRMNNLETKMGTLEAKVDSVE